MAIAAIWMSAVLPAWRQQATREKEAELIFRGQQYARAIYLYGQKMNGALPSNFDDLVSQHTLRHKWKDPITDDEFLPRVGCQTGIAAGGLGGPTLPAGSGAGRAGGNQSPALPPGIGVRGGGVGVVGGRGGPSPGATNLPGQPGGQIPGAGLGGQAGQGGICGVQSKSKAASIRIYNGQQEYDLWQFDILTASVQFQQNIAKLAGGSASGQGIGVPINMPGGRGIQPPGAGRGIGGPGGRSPGGFPGPGGAPLPGGPGAPGGTTLPGRGRG
jgi:type II secretory pathway pseudopilin PulG